MGRIPHNDVITIVSNADYSILIRDNNLVNSAGFPTKFVESISCGTPVISNENSCISKYYNGNKNGVLVSDDNLLYDLYNIFQNNPHYKVDSDCFDYKRYVGFLSAFFKKVNCNNC